MIVVLDRKTVIFASFRSRPRRDAYRYRAQEVGFAHAQPLSRRSAPMKVLSANPLSQTGTRPPP
jgi:hypothetical protein